jgi:hypothetical protein
VIRRQKTSQDLAAEPQMRRIGLLLGRGMLELKRRRGHPVLHFALDGLVCVPVCAVLALDHETHRMTVEPRRIDDHGGVIPVLERVVRPAGIRQRFLFFLARRQNRLGLFPRQQDLAERLAPVGGAHAEAVERDLVQERELVQIWHGPTPGSNGAYRRVRRTEALRRVHFLGRPSAAIAAFPTLTPGGAIASVAA